MPIVSSQYWNSIHGNTPEEVKQDFEGMQTMKVLGNNMAFLLKSIALGKEKYGLPDAELKIATNFIRQEYQNDTNLFITSWANFI